MFNLSLPMQGWLAHSRLNAVSPVAFREGGEIGFPSHGLMRGGQDGSCCSGSSGSNVEENCFYQVGERTPGGSVGETIICSDIRVPSWAGEDQAGGTGTPPEREQFRDFQFKTVINLGENAHTFVNSGFCEGDSRGCCSSPKPSSSEDERSSVRYSVVLNIGKENLIENITSNFEHGVGSSSSSQCHVRSPVSPHSGDPSPPNNKHFLPPPHPVSSLQVRSPPPPVPKRQHKTKLSPRGEFLASLLRAPSVLRPRCDITLTRNESRTSDYSTSSQSGVSSTSGSPVSSLSSKSSRHDSSSSRDSDYFGSSSEDDEFEEGKAFPVVPVASKDDDWKEGKEEEEEDPNDQLAPLKPILGFPGLRRMRRFARAVATSKEYDLEQRIALEIKMREGTAKLLAACGAKGPQAGQPHTLEAAKSLLTSNERMTAYMAELQRRRTSKRTVNDGCNPSLARVCLSDLRMPLLWKDVEHFKNKGDNRKFAVFVLLKIGTEIYDTVMVNPVDRSMTDICFDDIIVFNDIPPNFNCSLEVYSYLFENEMLMASIPRKLKKTLHSSISRTVGRKLAVSLRDELASGDPGPKFEMVASAQLNVENISNNISTFDLCYTNSENRPDQLPLLGHFCCRFAAQPDCFTQDRISAYAKVPESDNPEPSWCRVFGWRVEVWETKEDAETSPHHPLALSLDTSTEITSTSASVLQLSNNQGPDRGLLTLSFKTGEECKKWLKVLRQHVSDYERWGKAAEEEMEILTPQPSRHSFIMPKRGGRFTSLYEETPLRDGSPSSEKSSTDDLYNSTAFVNSYCTPAPMAPRTRAFTMSSRSSFRRWGSVRANMPFFKTKS